MNPRGIVAAVKEVAGSHKTSIIMMVIYIGMMLLEEFVYEDIFVCSCENGRGMAVGSIIGSIAVMFIFTLGLVQRTGIACSCSATKEYDSGIDVATQTVQIEMEEAENSNEGKDENNTGEAAEDKKHEVYVYHGFAGCNRDCRKEFSKDLLWALAGSAIWVIVLCLDGDYIACASTITPYRDFNCSNFVSSELPPYSSQYKHNKDWSRGAAGIAILIGLCVLMMWKGCCCCTFKDRRCRWGCRCCKQISINVQYHEKLSGKQKRRVIDLLCDGKPVALQAGQDIAPRVADEVYQKIKSYVAPSTEQQG